MTDTKKAMAELRKKIEEPKGWDGVYGTGATHVPDLVKLTDPQMRMLDKVCRTNGGGIHAGFGGRETTMLRRLFDKGLVQGKLNGDGYAVHTREGWDAWKRYKSGQA